MASTASKMHGASRRGVQNAQAHRRALDAAQDLMIVPTKASLRNTPFSVLVSAVLDVDCDPPGHLLSCLRRMVMTGSVLTKANCIHPRIASLFPPLMSEESSQLEESLREHWDLCEVNVESVMYAFRAYDSLSKVGPPCLRSSYASSSEALTRTIIPRALAGCSDVEPDVIDEALRIGLEYDIRELLGSALVSEHVARGMFIQDAQHHHVLEKMHTMVRCGSLPDGALSNLELMYQGATHLIFHPEQAIYAPAFLYAFDALQHIVMVSLIFLSRSGAGFGTGLQWVVLGALFCSCFDRVEFWYSRTPPWSYPIVFHTTSRRCLAAAIVAHALFRSETSLSVVSIVATIALLRFASVLRSMSRLFITIEHSLTAWASIYTCCAVVWAAHPGWATSIMHWGFAAFWAVFAATLSAGVKNASAPRTQLLFRYTEFGSRRVIPGPLGLVWGLCRLVPFAGPLCYFCGPLLIIVPVAALAWTTVVCKCVLHSAWHQTLLMTNGQFELVFPYLTHGSDSSCLFFISVIVLVCFVMPVVAALLPVGLYVHVMYRLTFATLI
jgi:hypothetical protein